MLRRSILAAVLASALTALTVGTVAAHECVISSRSAQGDEGAANSKVWDKLFLADVLGFIHAEVGGPALTADQIAWAVENRGDLPEYWVTRFDKTIGAGSSNPNLANGSGLDHLVPMVGEQVVGLYFAALEQ
jgi:hypothetical protein